MSDVIVIGGGVIGLTIAYELSGRGAAVTVVDQGPLGREASWAGAGMLPPGDPTRATEPAERLRGASHRLWADFSRQLLSETGIDNGYLRCGGLEIRRGGPVDELAQEIAAAAGTGIEIEPLTPDAAREYEPNLGADITAAYRLPQMGQVRNPRHLRALEAACVARGVRMLPGTPVHDFVRQGESVTAVQTAAGKLSTGQVVVAAGAWSQMVLAAAGCQVPTRPLRGQIVLLQTQTLPIRHVIQNGKQYLVPRADGRILIGSTEDDVGFQKQNTSEGMRGLLDFAVGVVPCLADAQFERAWSGLRPRSADGLPYLGRIPELKNVFVATGHFRDGLQLSPITGKVIAELMLGEEPSVSLEPFACDRHAGAGEESR